MTIALDHTDDLGAAQPTKITFASGFRDVRVVAKRNIKRITRTPRLLIFASIQPIMFLTLFRFVFGGNIPTGNLAYVDFLVPGVLVQATLFGGTTAIALSTDLASGMVDRFRSLPIARSAVLAGRTLSDSTRNIFVAIILLSAGVAMGFRVHNGLLGLLAGVAVVLIFAFCFSWLQAWIGLVAKDPETAQIASFLPLFPFIFASTIFQPVSSFPTWLQGFAEHQPISVTASTARALIQGSQHVPGHPELVIIKPVSDTIWEWAFWCVAFLVVFIPLAVRTYRKMS